MEAVALVNRRVNVPAIVIAYVDIVSTRPGRSVGKAVIVSAFEVLTSRHGNILVPNVTGNALLVPLSVIISINTPAQVAKADELFGPADQIVIKVRFRANIISGDIFDHNA